MLTLTSCCLIVAYSSQFELKKRHTTNEFTLMYHFSLLTAHHSVYISISVSYLGDWLC